MIYPRRMKNKKIIGKLSKCDTYIYINELMNYMNNDIKGLNLPPINNSFHWCRS